VSFSSNKTLAQIVQMTNGIIIL